MENEIETKTSDELGLIAIQQHQAVLQAQQTIANAQQNMQIIAKELDARMKRHLEVEKEVKDG